LQFDKIALFMATSLAFMFLALFVGIFRLMSLNFSAPAVLAEMYGLHSIIMVFGFLAAIITTERVAGVRMIPGAQKLRAAVVMVPSITMGVVALAAGYIWQFQVLRYLGGIMLVIGCIAFMATLTFLRRSTEGKLPFDFMILSVVSLTLAAAFSALTLPVDNLGFIMLLISFPILFILGERVELTRIISTPRSNGRFRLAFVSAAASVLVFAVGAGERFTLLGNLAFLTGSILLLAVFLSVLITENQNLRSLLKSAKPLQHYVSRHVHVAYVWGVIGMILAVTYSLSGFGLDLYDPFIHSLTIGFIGTMMLAHGPVILPGVLKREFSEEKLSMLPLSVLTVSLILRAGGELLMLVFYSASVRLIIGLSGWLVLGAVLLFLRSIVNGMIGSTKLVSPSLILRRISAE